MNGNAKIQLKLLDLKTTLPDSITGLLLRKHIAEKPLPEMTLENYRTFYDF